jgi:hypothetical protein
LLNEEPEEGNHATVAVPSHTKFEGEPTMTTWSKDELRKIAEADDLHISRFREDGVTYGTPTWIWSVEVDDALYVRGYKVTPRETNA